MYIGLRKIINCFTSVITTITILNITISIISGTTTINTVAVVQAVVGDAAFTGVQRGVVIAILQPTSAGTRVDDASGALKASGAVKARGAFKASWVVKRAEPVRARWDVGGVRVLRLQKSRCFIRYS